MSAEGPAPTGGDERNQAGLQASTPGLGVTLARAALMCGLVVAADQASKVWIRGQPALVKGLRPALGDWLYWTWAENPGAAFGMFAEAENRGLLFVVVGVVALGGGLWALRALRGQLALLPEFIGLIVGGAMGNSLDRALRGSVTDFVVLRAPAGALRDGLQAQLGGFTWPAFNVADLAIVIAMLAAAPLLLAGQREPDALPAAPPQRARLD